MTLLAFISFDDLMALESHAKSARPNEACALLLGDRKLEGQPLQITAVRISDNVSTGDPRTSFEIDPKVLFDTQRRARRGGPEIIGVWHSHPMGNPAPSKVDKARSVEKSWVWLITGFSDDSAVTEGYLSGANDPTKFVKLDLITSP